MDRGVARGLLDLTPDATAEDIETAYWAKCNELEARVRIAPTNALKQVYREALEKLEEARDALLDAAEGDAEEAESEVDDDFQQDPEPPVLPQKPPPPPHAPPETKGPPPLQRDTPPSRPRDSAQRTDGPERGGAISDTEAAVGFFEGRVLGDRYEVRRRIGIGMHGAVYAGFDRQTGKEVALKVILPRLIEDPGVREDFHKDAKVASYLAHPSIVHVFGLHEEGTTERLDFVVMELIHGDSLATVYKIRGKTKQSFTVPEVARIGTTLCDALHYSHQYLVHGDVKPENVFIEANGAVKLSDFGMSRLIIGSEQGKAPSPYLAPELVRGGAITHLADQYSVAALLYEMLTGQVPRPGTPPVNRARQDVPPNLAEAIERALQESAENRFPDQQALGKALGGRSGAPSGGIPIRAIAAGVGLLLLGGVTYFVFSGEDSEGDRPIERTKGPAVNAEGTAAAEAAREETASAAEEAVKAAAQARLDAERQSDESTRESTRRAAADTENTRVARREIDARERQEMLNASATRGAAELERANDESRAQLERQATARVKADAERTATARVKLEADRVATARAEAESARLATATAEVEAARKATLQAGVADLRAATARAVEIQREATISAGADAERTAVARGRDDKDRETRAQTRDGFIAPLNATVASLRFFERGAGESVPESQRRYATEFPRSSARFISWELSLTHPAQGKRSSLEIRSVCKGPGGRVFGDGDLKSYIEGSWGKSTHVYGWGFADPGQWERGTYKVELYVDGTRVTSGSFEID